MTEAELKVPIVSCVQFQRLRWSRVKGWLALRQRWLRGGEAVRWVSRSAWRLCSNSGCGAAPETCSWAGSAAGKPRVFRKTVPWWFWKTLWHVNILDAFRWHFAESLLLSPGVDGHLWSSRGCWKVDGHVFPVALEFFGGVWFLWSSCW